MSPFLYIHSPETGSFLTPKPFILYLYYYFIVSSSVLCLFMFSSPIGYYLFSSVTGKLSGNNKKMKSKETLLLENH
jgi:hypothetical protein